MQGKRRDINDDTIALLEPGDYGKHTDGTWYMRVPATGFGVGSLKAHTVQEHEDGTITVSPSILCTGHFDRQWHGYLERGIWREV